VRLEIQRGELCLSSIGARQRAKHTIKPRGHDHIGPLEHAKVVIVFHKRSGGVKPCPEGCGGKDKRALLHIKSTSCHPLMQRVLACGRQKSVSFDPSGYSKRLCTASVPVANVCVGLCVLADVEYGGRKVKRGKPFHFKSRRDARERASQPTAIIRLGGILLCGHEYDAFRHTTTPERQHRRQVFFFFGILPSVRVPAPVWRRPPLFHLSSGLVGVGRFLFLVPKCAFLPLTHRFQPYHYSSHPPYYSTPPPFCQPLSFTARTAATHFPPTHVPPLSKAWHTTPPPASNPPHARNELRH